MIDGEIEIEDEDGERFNNEDDEVQRENLKVLCCDDPKSLMPENCNLRQKSDMRAMESES